MIRQPIHTVALSVLVAFMAGACSPDSGAPIDTFESGDSDPVVDVTGGDANLLNDIVPNLDVGTHQDAGHTGNLHIFTLVHSDSEPLPSKQGTFEVYEEVMTIARDGVGNQGGWPHLSKVLGLSDPL